MVDNEELASIPLCAHEAAVTRMQRVVRWCAVGWAVSVLALAAVIVGVIW